MFFVCCWCTLCLLNGCSKAQHIHIWNGDDIFILFSRIKKRRNKAEAQAHVHTHSHLTRNKTVKRIYRNMNNKTRNNKIQQQSTDLYDDNNIQLEYENNSRFNKNLFYFIFIFPLDAEKLLEFLLLLLFVIGSEDWFGLLAIECQ